MKKTLVALATILTAIPSLAHAEDVAVSLAGPMTGQYAAFGEQLKVGAKEAVEEINKTGGVLGKQINLGIEDDACDPKQAVSVANAVVAKGAAVMLGHFCSGSTIPASEIYAENNILEITVSSNPAVTGRGLKQIFRIIGGDDQQAVVAADYIASHFAQSRIAVVDDKSAYGNGLAQLVIDGLKSKSIDVVINEAINPGEKDYAALVTRLKDAKIDVLYFGGYHAEAGLILRQAADAGLKLQLIGGDALGTSEFAAIVGATSNNTLFTFPTDPTKVEGSQDVVKRFIEKKLNPEGYALYAYASVQVFAEASKKAGSTQTEDVAKVLRTDGVDTILGNIKFDDHGNVNNPGFVMNVWDGTAYKAVSN